MISIDGVKVIHYIYKLVLQTTKIIIIQICASFHYIIQNFISQRKRMSLCCQYCHNDHYILSLFFHIHDIFNINNKYNMQATPQTIQSSQTCSLSCTSQQKHTGQHTKISMAILRELLLEKINNYDIKSIPQVQAFINELTNLRTFINTCIDNIEMEWKMQVSLGLSGDSFDACKILLEKNDVGVVKCKQVYMVEMAVTQYNYQACKAVVVGKLEEMSVKLVAELSKYQDKFAKKSSQKIKKQAQKKQSSNIKKQEEQVKKQEKVDYIDQSISEIRPERQTLQKIQPSTTRNNQNRKHSENEYKIIQLFDKSTNVYFTTTFKVIKILRYVKILKIDKVMFIGADQTAKAIFVVDKSFDIQVGSILTMTQCKMYDYHGSERQIQNTKYSKVSVGGNIARVNTNICLQISGDGQRLPQSRNNRRISPDTKYEHSPDRSEINIPDDNEKSIRDRSEKMSKENTSQSLTQSPKKLETKSSSTEYKKIKDIEPGDEDVNIVAKIHEIIEIGTYKMVCYIGDDTGIVKIQLPTTLPFLKEGLGVKLLRVQSAVVDEHILILIKEGSKIEPMNIIFPKIDISNDVSFQEWLSDDDQSE